LVFVYALVVNVIQRPDGNIIASFFIGTIIFTSLVSRVWRATELRAERIEIDETARRFIEEGASGDEIQVVANRRQAGDKDEYDLKEREQRKDNHIPADTPILFLEVDVDDPSEFEDVLEVGAWKLGATGCYKLRARPCPTPSPPSCSICAT
jgi:hypothetical protein